MYAFFNKMTESINGFGLSSKYEYYELELDSLDYTSAQSQANTPLNWPTFEVGGAAPLSNVVAVKVIQAEIPFSYYVFTATNGTFVLQESAGAAQNIVIPPGNYTSNQMVVQLKTLLDAASVAAGNSFIYTVTYDDQTQKITYVSTDAGGFTFTFGNTTDPGHTNPRLYLGFPAGDTSTMDDTLVSPNSVLLSGPNYLFLNSISFGQVTNNLLPKGGIKRGNQSYQVCKIPVTAAPGEIVFYDDPNPTFWFNLGNAATFQTLDFFLTSGHDTRMTALDLNGLSFSIKLGILTQKATSTNNFGAAANAGGLFSRTGPL